jgi:hypothetical protein
MEQQTGDSRPPADGQAAGHGEITGETSGGGALVIQAHGGAILRGGVRGHQGGGGRPPDEFRRRMAEIASSDEAFAFLEACARGDFGPKFALAALAYASERGYGKAAPATKAVAGSRIKVYVLGPQDAAHDQSPEPIVDASYSIEDGGEALDISTTDLRNG